MARKRTALKRFRDFLIRVFARILLLIGRLLPDSIGYLFGGWLGSLGHFLAGFERNRAQENLRQAYPDASDYEIGRIARESFRHFGRVLFEAMKLPRLTRRKIDRNFEFQGLELINKALSEGRGVLVATGHIGNWELMGAAAARMAIPVNVIARRLYDDRLNDIVIGLRKSAGVKTILRESQDSAKQILRALRSGEMLAMLIDQDIRVEGAFVDFFGRKAFTPTGAAALALRTGALFAAVSCQRTDVGRHLVRIQEIEINTGLDRERAIIDATHRVTRQLEVWIRERPEQWPWFHDRWRTRPPGDSKPKNDTSA